MSAILRKLNQLRSDPVLRSWLLKRALRLTEGPPRFVPHRPPYLSGSLPFPSEPVGNDDGFECAPAPAPLNALEIRLHGNVIRLAAEDAKSVFLEPQEDHETYLGLHRFAWLPFAHEPAAPEWVWHLWETWLDQFGDGGEGWPWHPYTAAERAINILTFARSHGLPTPAQKSMDGLARHAAWIADHLEYFGEHYTSNHLANNGRGLFTLGLALGLSKAAALGREILLNEAGRIFLPSGMLREGSSHYHLLLTKNYLAAWLLAVRHDDEAAAALGEVAGRALAAAQTFNVPGAVPLIGDISPDCPPAFVAGIASGKTDGWLGTLSEAEQGLITSLSAQEPRSPGRPEQKDGWLRWGCEGWDSLWYISPDGFPPMPGHGHQDCGSFQLYFNDQSVFVDLGRGSYGMDESSAFACSVRAHNSLSIDDMDPFPTNRPYYSPSFRAAVSGPPPDIEAARDRLEISHMGFARRNGLGRYSRRCEVNGGGLTLTDSVDGTGTRRICRALHTPLRVESTAAGVLLRSDTLTFRLAVHGEINIKPSRQWIAYGEHRPVTTIEIATRAPLPWSESIVIEVF